MHTEISRVDTNLVKAFSNPQSNRRGKMNISHQRNVVTGRRWIRTQLDKYILWTNYDMKFTIAHINSYLLFLHKGVLNLKASICFFLPLNCYPHNLSSFICNSHHLAIDCIYMNTLNSISIGLISNVEGG